MSYTRFNVEAWQRKEHYHVYNEQVNCGFSLTAKIDITSLYSFISLRDYRFYPTMIYLLSSIVNKHDEFKLSKKTMSLFYGTKYTPVSLFFIIKQKHSPLCGANILIIFIFLWIIIIFS